MRSESYATNYNYLNIKVKPRYPKFLHKIVLYLMEHASLPVVKILGPILGFGISKGGVKRYPELFLKLKDGTKLATDVYIPKKVFKKRGKAPTIVIRLPYWKNRFSILGVAFAAYGYVTIMQDTRGCAHSEGFNFFLQTERDDGLELLKWISKQYWYNGKIGTTGGSYFGMTQNVLSWDNDLLTCINPAVCSFSNLWRNNGGLNIHSLSTSIYRIMINVSVNREAPLVDLFTKEMQELFLNPRYVLYNDPIVKKGEFLKFSDFLGKSIDECVQIISDFYKMDKWNLSKRNFKIYFKFLEDFLKMEKDIENMPGLFNFDIKKFSQPAYFLAGWQDMFIEHIIKDFTDLKKYSKGEAQKYSKLIIGPWAHADKGHPEGSILEFGIRFLNKGWFDYWLKENKNAFPLIEKPSIRYYTYGSKLWSYTEEWPPKGVEYRQLYFHSNGNANSANGNGILSFEQPNSDEPEDHYTFDPLNPVITRGGKNLGILKGSQKQKKSERRKDVLVYTSAPLIRGIEITGPVKLVLYASSSAVDTDFMVKLCDVYPSGNKSLNIVDAGIRARYREGESKQPSLIEPGKIYKYEIDVGNTSIYFQPGHRIRIDITSSNFPRFDINSNLGGESNDKGYIIAEQKIYHTSKYPSHVLMPVLARKKD